MMLNQEKVFDMMYSLLDLKEEMSLSSFTSISMCFMCAMLEALQQAPPMVRLQVHQAVLDFLDTVTRDNNGADHFEAWKLVDKLGLVLQTELHHHEQYIEAAKN